MTTSPPISTKSIFEDHLLLDKRVTLEFPSLAAFESFKAQLRVYKSRYNKIINGIAPEMLETRKIKLTHTQDKLTGKLVATVWLDEAPKDPPFAFISST